MKGIFLIIIIFFINSCDFKKDQDIVPDNRRFNLETQEFVSEINLEQDMEINSKVVRFLFPAKIKLNQFSLTIVADEIHFDNTKIHAFENTDMNGCELNGLDGGNIYLFAKIIIGNPTFSLQGQNAGKTGFGYNKAFNDNELYHPSDKLRNDGFVLNLCEKSRPMNKDTVNNYWKFASFNGGRSSSLYIDSGSSIEDFSPEFDLTVSKGSPVSNISYEAGKATWYGYTNKGLKGEGSKYCFLKDRYELCFKNYEELKNEQLNLNQGER